MIVGKATLQNSHCNMIARVRVIDPSEPAS
jgi:hypothetical protein